MAWSRTCSPRATSATRLAAQAVLLEKDREKLKEMSDDLPQAKDDLADPL